MPDHSIIFSLFLIFAGAAVAATLALYVRQALIIGYIILGVALGPYGLGMITDTSLIQDIAHIGIIFLLFLLGLNLYPQKLFQLFGAMSLVTAMTSIVFAISGLSIAIMFGYSWWDAALIGVATMFSSTIIGLKLLPTTVLHHRHTGEVVISILLLQDMLAIIVLLVLQGLGIGEMSLMTMAAPFLALPLLALFAYLVEKNLILPLIKKFDHIQEYIFLVAIGWCLGMAQLAEWVGLSYEIGAFIGGVAMATNPISRYIAESLKPLRDFFLIMFFFALGASLDLSLLSAVILPALLIAGGTLLFKPIVFTRALISVSEPKKLARETGWRLGQMSEFSLLIAFIAAETSLFSAEASSLIHVATLLTFIGSTYLIVQRFPTPIALSEDLRRD